jgi:von Willebrand factor type A domain
MVRVNIFGSSRGSNKASDEKSLSLGSDDYSITVPDMNPNKLGVEIHPFPAQDGLLVRVQPPQQPTNPKLGHVPCDIVLVIDVSGSMATDAPAPVVPGQKTEKFGLSVLDLTKHAARTILETLNENDRLGIVTFASEVEVCVFPATVI